MFDFFLFLCLFVFFCCFPASAVPHPLPLLGCTVGSPKFKCLDCLPLSCFGSASVIDGGFHVAGISNLSTAQKLPPSHIFRGHIWVRLLGGVKQADEVASEIRSGPRDAAMVTTVCVVSLLVVRPLVFSCACNPVPALDHGLSLQITFTRLSSIPTKFQSRQTCPRSAWSGVLTEDGGLAQLPLLPQLCLKDQFHPATSLCQRNLCQLLQTSEQAARLDPSKERKIVWRASSQSNNS